MVVLGALGLIACGGDDEDEVSASSESTTTHGSGEEADSGVNPELSNAERIEQMGNDWAPRFAEAGPVTCRYMGQPACELANCERVPNRPIENCSLPSTAFRQSFADATVKRVVIDGHHAAAEFSNGESVEFEGQKPDKGDEGVVVGSAWFISKRWVKSAGTG